MSLLSKVADTATGVANTVKNAAGGVKATAHRSVKEYSENSDESAFVVNFPNLAQGGSVLCSTHVCRVLTGGASVPGLLFITSTHLCFVSERYRDSVALSDIASYLPAVALEIDPSSPEARTIAAVSLRNNGTIASQSVFSSLFGGGGSGSSTNANSQQQQNAEGELSTPGNESSLAGDSSFFDDRYTSDEVYRMQRVGALPPFILPLPSPLVIPTALEIFATNGQLFQFVGFEDTYLHTAANIGKAASNAERAIKHFDIAWRSMVTVVNRNARRGSSGSSALAVGNEKLENVQYCTPHLASGKMIGPPAVTSNVIVLPPPLPPAAPTSTTTNPTQLAPPIPQQQRALPAAANSVPQASHPAPVVAPKPADGFVPNPDHVHQLVEIMGFEPRAVNEALKATNNDLNLALQVLLS
jgi:hypothetical protein